MAAPVPRPSSNQDQSLTGNSVRSLPPEQGIIPPHSAVENMRMLSNGYHTMTHPPIHPFEWIAEQLKLRTFAYAQATLNSFEPAPAAQIILAHLQPYASYCSSCLLEQRIVFDAGMNFGEFMRQWQSGEIRPQSLPDQPVLNMDVSAAYVVLPNPPVVQRSAETTSTIHYNLLRSFPRHPYQAISTTAAPPFDHITNNVDGLTAAPIKGNKGKGKQTIRTHLPPKPPSIKVIRAECNDKLEVARAADDVKVQGVRDTLAARSREGQEAHQTALSTLWRECVQLQASKEKSLQTHEMYQDKVHRLLRENNARAEEIRAAQRKKNTLELELERARAALALAWPF